MNLKSPWPHDMTHELRRRHRKQVWLWRSIKLCAYALLFSLGLLAGRVFAYLTQ